MKYLNNIIFFLFLTFSIFNLYKIEIIYTLGKFGKMIIIFYIFIFLYWKFIIKRNNTFILNKYIYLFIVMILMIVVGSVNYQLHNTDLESYFYSSIFIIYMIYFFCYISTMLYYYKEESFNIVIEKIKKIIVFNMILGFFLSIIFKVPYLIENKDSYAFGGFLESGLIFGWLALLGFFTTYLSSIKNKLRIFLLVIFILFILFSEGRGSQLTLIIFYLMIAYFNINKIINNNSFIYFFKLILILTILTILFIISTNIGFKDLNNLTTGRLFIWQLTIKEIFTNDILYFGYGFGTFSDLILNKYHNLSYYFKDLLDSNSTLSLHSSYLSILVAGGFISLLSFLSLIFYVIKNSSIVIKSLFISLLSGAIVEQFIISPNIPISTFFWLIVILTIINNKTTNLRNF